MAEKREITFNVIKSFGILSTSASGWSKELNLISWNEGRPKLEIRDWAPGRTKAGKGVGLTPEEVAVLKELLSEIDPADLVQD
ncbi:MAG: hypothetical protein GX907_04180 [Clostridiaceae bacterium]|nr:hypothetical protein [Clostridiaceae bacterium]NLZ70514.1 hypothetical protein [Clostridiaceae bacterium]